jgi:polar amino acid transport system ATP-binding protein
MAARVNVLAVSGLRIRRDNRLIVADVSFSASPGEVVALMGASGSGKTSILRAIAGLDAFDAGSIDVDGVSLAPGSVPRGRLLRELHRRVGMVFQFHHLFAHMTALHNVWLAPVHVLHVARGDAEARAAELLEMLGVGERRHALPHELSGGEAQRVAIARALAVDPPLLLMDEPTASLDRSRRAELAASLRDLSAHHRRTVVVATHDADFARASAGRIALLEEGRIVREGTPTEILTYSEDS